MTTDYRELARAAYLSNWPLADDVRADLRRIMDSEEGRQAFIEAVADEAVENPEMFRVCMLMAALDFADPHDLR